MTSSKRTAYGTRLAVALMFFALLIFNSQSAHANDISRGYVDCVTAPGSTTLNTSACFDSNVEAVQEGLLTIERAAPSNTPQKGGTTSYEIWGKTIGEAVKVGVMDSRPESLSNVPAIKWSNFTLESDDQSDNVSADGKTITWGNFGTRIITATYKSCYDVDENGNPICHAEGNMEGSSVQLNYPFEVTIKDAVSDICTNGADNPPLCDQFIKSPEQGNQSGDGNPFAGNSAITGVAVGMILLLIATLLLLALLLKRRKKKDEDDTQSHLAQTNHDYGIIKYEDTERNPNDK